MVYHTHEENLLQNYHQTMSQDAPVNFLTTKKQTTKFSSANCQKMLYYIERVNTVDLDDAAHHEPPHQGLRCWQIQLFSPLEVKELTWVNSYLVYIYFSSATSSQNFNINCKA